MKPALSQRGAIDESFIARSGAKTNGYFIDEDERAFRLAFMLRDSRAIFVLRTSDGVDLAFAAANLDAAEALCRTTWFVQAVDEFRQHNGGTKSPCYQARPASDAEAALYRRVADEFAELSNCLFIAPLTAGHSTAECVF